jgi:hypothetical protein
MLLRIFGQNQTSRFGPKRALNTVFTIKLRYEDRFAGEDSWLQAKTVPGKMRRQHEEDS